MAEFLRWELAADGVLTLTMDSPDTRNALSDASQFEAFVAACARIERDKAVRAVVLTGNGPAFCAGGNVKHMRERMGIAAGAPAAIRNTYKYGIQTIPLAVWNLEVPTIAAVNGPAIGAGCDLACMCDIRIASDKAVFAESFVKLGIIPGDGGAWLLPRAVGLSKAAEMAFTGDAIDAAEALRCGLVSRVVAPEKLLGEAQALARRIAVNPPQAVRLAKRLMREGMHQRLDSILELSAAYQALAHHTADHREAMEAFFAKRPGKYDGT
ncbi:MAG: crotonase/enoyl-CoA hydratase family protein [Alphaproteobacteria bacterium]|nr:crotonase/enoyl-CoA hydratase family protein [Alphaproteobacteria bacterium]